MQILVFYHSKGGNTKKLAQAVAKGVDSVAGESALLKPAPEVTREDFLSSAGVIAGSPVYFGVMAAEVKKVFDDLVGTRKKMEGKVGAAFQRAFSRPLTSSDARPRTSPESRPLPTTSSP